MNIEHLARLERTRSNSFGVASAPQGARPNIQKVLYLPPLKPSRPSLSKDRARSEGYHFLLDKIQGRHNELEEIYVTRNLYFLTKKADIEDAAKYYVPIHCKVKSL